MTEMLRTIIDNSVITRDGALWPPLDTLHWQEPEIVIGHEHTSSTTSKIGSLTDVSQPKGPEGLHIFYYLAQDLKCFVFSLTGLHFWIKPL